MLQVALATKGRKCKYPLSRRGQLATSPEPSTSWLTFVGVVPFALQDCRDSYSLQMLPCSYIPLLLQSRSGTLAVRGSAGVVHHLLDDLPVHLWPQKHYRLEKCMFELFPNLCCPIPIHSNELGLDCPTSVVLVSLV